MQNDYYFNFEYDDEQNHTINSTSLPIPNSVFGSLFNSSQNRLLQGDTIIFDNLSHSANGIISNLPADTVTLSATGSYSIRLIIYISTGSDGYIHLQKNGSNISGTDIAVNRDIHFITLETMQTAKSGDKFSVKIDCPSLTLSEGTNVILTFQQIF